MSYLGLLSVLEEGFLAGSVLSLGTNKVLSLGDLSQFLGIKSRDIYLGRCGDDKGRIDSAERNTVELVGPGNEEGTLVEGLEQHDAFATEATGKEDQNSARL